MSSTTLVSADFLAFVHSIGYTVTVDKGQRVFRPANFRFERPEFDQAKRHEVFLSGLPNDLYEEELLPFLNRIGSVYQIRFILNFSGKTKGSAYAIFTNVADSYRAVEFLNGQFIRPDCTSKIHVTFSVNNNRLNVSNLWPGLTAAQVKAELNKYLTGIEHVYLQPCCRILDLPDASCISTALVIFRNHQFAAAARRLLVPGSVNFGGRTLMAEWAKPKKFSTLFVRINYEAGHQLDANPAAELFLRKHFDFLDARLVKMVRNGNFLFLEYRNFDEALLVHQKFRAVQFPVVIQPSLQIVQVSWPNRK